MRGGEKNSLFGSGRICDWLIVALPPPPLMKTRLSLMRGKPSTTRSHPQHLVTLFFFNTCSDFYRALHIVVV